MRVAAVDYNVTIFEMWQQLVDKCINRRTGFDHQHNLSRLLEVLDKLFYGMAADDVFAFCAAFDKIVHFRYGTVKTSHRESFAFHVENEIFTHYRQPDKTNVSFCHFERLLFWNC